MHLVRSRDWPGRQLSFLGVLIAVLSARAFLASAFAEQGEATRVDLGMGQGAPGAEVALLLTLKAPDEVNVGTVVIEVAFPAALLSFQQARKAIAADAANAEVTTAVKTDEAQPDKTIVDITVKAEAGAFIPSGALLDLVFKVAAQAPLKETVTVQNAAQVLSNTDPPQNVEPVVGDTGEIIIAETTLVFSCFFYMH